MRKKKTEKQEPIPEKKPVSAKKAEKTRIKAEKAEQKRLKNLEEIKSTQMLLPIIDIQDGIIITKDNRFIMLMEFAPINFSLRTESEQDHIADAFGALLKIVPNNIQIKILSRKADVTEHIKLIRSLMETEESENCRAMQQDTINLIQDNAETGITKRFMLAFEYGSTAGLHSPKWEDITESMFSTAYQISSVLASPPCENELLSPIGDTDYVIDMLYNCICREQAEHIPCLDKCQMVIDTFLEQGRAKEGQYIPINEFISPTKVDVSNPKTLKIDGKYYAFGYILGNSYDTKCCSGWLNPLLSMGSGIDVDIFITKEEPEKVQSRQVYARRLNNVRFENADSTNADIEDLKKQIQAGYYIRQGMSNREKFCYFTILFTIVADTEKQLNSKIHFVKNNVTTQGQHIRIIMFNQEEAFLSSLPLCNPDKFIIKNGRRNALSCDLGTIYPFTSYEVNDAGGILLGNNLENNSPVFVNVFNKELYENANVAILGSSGKGKSYLSKLIMLRLRQQKVKNIIIAPVKGYEYRRSCQAVGGEFISISAGLPNVINIMEIRKMDHSMNEAIDGVVEKKSLLAEKIQTIQGFISLIAPDMSATEINALHDAITKTYEAKGITTRNKSLIDPKNPTKYKEMPILSDLYYQLRQNRASSRLADSLAPYVRDTIKCFNGQTNVNLNAMTTVLDLSSLKDTTKRERVADMLTLAMYITTDYVYDIIQEDRTERKAVLFDEIWKLIGAGSNATSAEFVLEIAKTVRALNTMAIFTTQDISDFFALDNGKYGKGILNNTKIKFVLGLDIEKEREQVANELNLSDSERQNIASYQRGDALLIANRNHIEINITASENEDKVVTTDPEKLKKYYGSQATEKRGYYI